LIHLYNFMTTISVPIPASLEEALNNLIKNGRGSNKAELVRRAIVSMVEEEAIQSVLRAQQEPNLSGDLRELAKKFR
ncbi:MAG: ribbon-helix-helix domain-containing protein, partial [bacterium]